jgi:hypothetical protein
MANFLCFALQAKTSVGFASWLLFVNPLYQILEPKTFNRPRFSSFEQQVSLCHQSVHQGMSA